MLLELIFLTSGFLWSITGNYISYKINKDYIFDPIHKLTTVDKYNKGLLYVKDILTFSPTIITSIINPIYGFSILKLYILCSILRPICYLSTSLPPPNHRFKKVIKHPFQTLSGSRGDLIYSGHMTLVTCNALAIFKFYEHILPYWVSYSLIISYITFTGFLTSITKSHYTVDVTIAIIISYLITTLLEEAHPDTFFGNLSTFIYNF